MLRLVLLVLCLAVSPVAIAAPSPDPWPHFARFDPASTASIDHSIWNRLLATYVKPGPDGVDRIAYAKVHRRRSAGTRRLSACPPGNCHFRLQPQRTAGLLDQSLQCPDGEGGSRPLPGALDPRHPHLARLLQRRPMGGEAAQDRGRGRLARRHPATDLMRPVWHDPRIHYVLKLRRFGQPRPAGGGLRRPTHRPPARCRGAALHQQPARRLVRRRQAPSLQPLQLVRRLISVAARRPSSAT